MNLFIDPVPFWPLHREVIFCYDPWLIVWLEISGRCWEFTVVETMQPCNTASDNLTFLFSDLFPTYYYSTADTSIFSARAVVSFALHTFSTAWKVKLFFDIAVFYLCIINSTFHIINLWLIAFLVISGHDGEFSRHDATTNYCFLQHVTPKICTIQTVSERWKAPLKKKMDEERWSSNHVMYNFI